jgi:hypothetical protein
MPLKSYYLLAAAVDEVSVNRSISKATISFNVVFLSSNSEVNGKGILVTGCGGPYGCEAPRFPHFLENRLTDGGEVVSLTGWPPFIPQEDSWHSFLLKPESNPGP